jgi:general secretion pathway protein M
MITRESISAYFVQYPRFSALIYVGLVAICCLATLLMLGDVIDRYRARNASLDMLSRLEGRSHGGAKDHRPPGSPFLEGQTITVAGAALLQPNTSSITNAGGTSISSEMVQQGARSKDG